MSSLIGIKNLGRLRSFGLLNRVVSSAFIGDTVDALYAYTLRKWNTLSTKAIRVRRSSDNAEQDIGFNGEDLDEASLLSFVGAGDGFVAVVYNQVNDGASGNMTETTQASQPAIVESGVINKANLKATINHFFGGASKTFDLSISVPQPFVQSFVFNPVDLVNLQRLQIGGTIVQTANKDITLVSASAISAADVVSSKLCIYDGVFNFPSGAIYLDGVQQATGTFTENRTLTGGTIMQFGRGLLSEYIILQGSNISTELNANQKQYYGIT